jgi:hypothetical protein
MLVCAVCFFAAPPALAQPDLDFNGISLSWPQVTLSFTVRCNRQLTNAYTAQNFRVFEDSMEVGEFTLYCPPSHDRCPITVAMVLDASGSMLGQKNQSTIGAAREFVQGMDGVRDRAAVLWFHDRDTLVQPMTNDKNLLTIAIDSLPAAGTTAAWDAAWSGINELINNSTVFDSCRAVILLTDGIDNASVRGLNDVIAHARKHGVRVFTVGLGADVNSVALAHLAFQTGGRYFGVDNPDMLAEIYQEIFLDIAGVARCVITYESLCADGRERTVELRLQKFCGGGDVGFRTYTAPSGGPPRETAVVTLGGSTVNEGDTLDIPFELQFLATRQFLAPGRTTISYDTSCLKWVGLGDTAGVLLKQSGLTAMLVSGGQIELRTTRKVMLEGPGLLARLRFVARPRERSGCCDIQPGSWELDGGCLAVTPVQATICVTTSEPLLRCRLDVPDSLVWNSSTASYDPSPFAATFTVENAGPRTARGGMAIISWNADAVEQRMPESDTLALPDLAPGESASVSWMLTPALRRAVDSIIVCVQAQYLNAAPARCCARVHVPPGGVGLVCTIDVPEIRADSTRGRYTPMPFEVVATIRNEGGRTSDTLEVTLVPASPLVNVTPPGTPLVVRPWPAVLRPNEQTTVRWRLDHPRTLIPAIRRIELQVRAGIDSTFCSHQLVMPALEGATLRARCSVPDSLAARADSTGWDPDTIAVVVYASNAGNIPVDGATATLVLPAGAERVNPTESLTKSFPGNTVLPGGFETSVSWLVHVSRRDPAPTALTFIAIVSGRAGSASIVRDTVRSTCVTHLAPLPPRVTDTTAWLACTLTGPDTVRFTGTAYAPDPIPIRVLVGNVGRGDAADVRLTMLQDARFTVLTAPQILLGSLAAGATVGSDGMLGFDLAVTPVDATRTDTVRVMVHAANAEPRICVLPLVVARARRPEVHPACSTEADTLSADPASPHPSETTVFVTIENSGDEALDDCVVTLGGTTRTMPTGATLHAVGRLAPGARITRGFGLRALCREGGLDTVTVTLRGRGGYGDATHVVRCSSVLTVMPCAEASLAISCSADDTISIDAQGVVLTPSAGVRLVMHNSGTRVVGPTRVRISLPAWLAVTGGGSSEVLVPGIAAGATVQVPFTLDVVGRPVAGSSACFGVRVNGGVEQQCCVAITVQDRSSSSLRISCSGTDSLAMTPSSACAIVRGGQGMLRVRFLPSQEVELLQGGGDTLVSAPADGDSVLVCVPVRLRSGSSGTRGSLTIVVEQAGGGIVTCERVFVLVRDQRAAPTCMLWTEPRDSVVFDHERSIFLASDPAAPDGYVRVGAEITLAAGITDTARAVEAFLLLPPGVALAPGEQARKVFGVMTGGSTLRVEWSVEPERRDTSHVVDLRMLLSAEGRTTTSCAVALGIGAAPLRVHVWMPDTVLARSGEVLTMPVYIGTTRGRDVRAYRLNIAYDDRLLAFEAATLPAVLMHGGWSGPDVTQHVENGRAVLRIAASTGGAPLASTRAEHLLSLRFRVAFGAGAQQFDIAHVPLRFVESITARDGIDRLVASINGASDGAAGTVALVTSDGGALLAGECVMPLRATSAYVLEQNVPNPFNPTTDIRYQVPQEGHVVVEVVDLFGRLVRTLVDGVQLAGAHAVRFDATGLAGGAYLCRMRSGDFVVVRRMLLVK